MDTILDLGLTTELRFLLYSAFLYFVWIFVHAGSRISEIGLKGAMGPRDNVAAPGVFAARAKRLVDNMQENLVLFAVVVLVAGEAGVSTDMTALGAQIFFYARVIHGLIYLNGLPQGRPLAWLVSLVGTGIIFVEVLTA